MPVALGGLVDRATGIADERGAEDERQDDPRHGEDHPHRQDDPPGSAPGRPVSAIGCHGLPPESGRAGGRVRVRLHQAPVQPDVGQLQQRRSLGRRRPGRAGQRRVEADVEDPPADAVRQPAGGRPRGQLLRQRRAEPRPGLQVRRRVEQERGTQQHRQPGDDLALAARARRWRPWRAGSCSRRRPAGCARPPPAGSARPARAGRRRRPPPAPGRPPGPSSPRRRWPGCRRWPPGGCPLGSGKLGAGDQQPGHVGHRRRQAGGRQVVAHGDLGRGCRPSTTA